MVLKFVTARCENCKANKDVTDIFFGTEGFMLTMICGHQVCYKTVERLWDQRRVF